MSRRRPRLASAALLLLGAAACHVPGGPAAPAPLDPHDPAAVARALLAPGLDPDDDRAIERLVDPRARDRAPAALVDALLALRPVAPATILAVEPLEGLGRTAVEAELPLAGGGTARVALDLRRTDDGWRVGWFAGAGVEWPPTPRGRGTGLSTSAAPGDL